MPSEIVVKRNQAGDCFVISWLGTVAVYNTNPLQLRFRRDFGRALRCVEHYLRSNILALTFDDHPDEVIIWDDHQGQEIYHLAPPALVNNILDHSDKFGDVLALHFRQNYLLVVAQNSSAIYETEQWQLLYLLPRSVSNPHGLGDMTVIAHPEEHFLLVAPGELSIAGFGELNIFRIPRHNSREVSLRAVSAHQTPVTTVAISPDGRYLATASERGTVIRLWSLTTVEIELVTEFQRGLEVTHITSFCFQTVRTLPTGDSSPVSDYPYLAVASATGTIHLYLPTSPPPFSTSSATHSSSAKINPALLDTPPSAPPLTSASSGSTHKGWWSRFTRHKVVKDIQSLLPKYLFNPGSQLQVATGTGGGQLLTLTPGEVIIVSSRGYYQKYGYKIDKQQAMESTYWPIEAVQLS